MLNWIVDSLLLLHAGFIAFVVLGGLLLLRWPQLIWLHLPAAAWGAAVELAGWPCPLTTLENHVRQLAGQSAYAEGFIAHYLYPIIYPIGLTTSWQVVLGVGVIAINALVYGVVWTLRRKRHQEQGVRQAHITKPAG